MYIYTQPRSKPLTWAIGIGAVFYVEHTRHLFPKPGEASTEEEENLVAAMIPVVYFLVIFSIVVHGLSIPALDAFYAYKKIPPISESEPAEIRSLSVHEALPNNARMDSKRNSVFVHNRFSRPVSTSVGPELYRWNNQVRDSDATFRSASQPTDIDYASKLQSIRFAEDYAHEKANLGR